MTDLPDLGLPPVHELPLGRLPTKHDDRTLLAGTYMEAVSPPPGAVDWLGRVPSWPMYANDRVGDCTCAAAGHIVGQQSFDAGSPEVLFGDGEILAMYSAVTGYNPADPSTDQGAVCLDVLNYWRKTGLAGHRLTAYAKLDPGNLDQIKKAIALTGAVYIGVALPANAQAETGPARTWSSTAGEAGSWGGHCVPVGAYDSSNRLSLITWGFEQSMTEGFWRKYVEEAYLVLGPEWLRDGHDAHGFDINYLLADVAAIGGNHPDPAPPAPPSPGPTPPPPPPPPTPESDPLKIALTDQRVIGKVKLAAVRAGLSYDAYVQHRLAMYFRIADAMTVPGETEAELDLPSPAELADIGDRDAPPF